MKRFLNFLLLVVCLDASAQTNLILNPSFEDTLECPDYLGQIEFAEHWIMAVPTSDYFNGCTNGVITSVPRNFFGYQHPRTGMAYGGFTARTLVQDTSHEIIGQKLLQPLETGTRYYLSFYISLALDFNNN